MITVALVAFWASVAALIWVYFLYPLLALFYGRLIPVRLGGIGRPADSVTVGVAVYNGVSEIAERLANIAGDPSGIELEIIVGSDGSTDGTDDLVRDLAATDPRIRLLDLARVGQSATQSAIVEAARSEVVILTDVETRFAPGCLAALVAPFSSPRVGAVTGVLAWHYDQQTGTARHESLYWRYEQWVRAAESRAGWLAAGTGALLALRRSAYQPSPANTSLDQMLPLYCRAAGLLVLVAPDAVGSDRGTASLGELFNSRVRIATQGIEANLRMSGRITPWRRPGSFLALWSHKILRWATPFLAALAASAGAVLFAAGESPLFLVPGAAALVLGSLALISYLGLRAGRAMPLTGLALTIVAVNLAFSLAWLNVILRRPIGAWESGERR